MAVVAIRQDAPGWRVLPQLDALIRRAVEAALGGDGAKLRQDVEISILLTDDAAIRDLNARWRGKDKATNVLSFPAADADRLHEARALGDIVIALETALREAGDESKEAQDHVAHLVVHGVLHLLGRDHETDADAEEMEGLERVILARLGVSDPYAASEAAPR